ncbi:hypothetical protein INS49_015383 [Diaporthe citri]|uniref:uncharacterized protein n=1 Tax=Diaporthe citri TaxID=83186 RepID=UPI001C80ABFB|nr:uncharacterized protein INS49_015383 [Diaporthe citri]KAG6355998.1 hypothetical protein INS49_015383 [Diaporthe citri]
MQLSTIAWIFAALMAGQTLATPAKKAATDGQACTGSVSNLQHDGVCKAGKCNIEITGNELDIVASDDCA